MSVLYMMMFRWTNKQPGIQKFEMYAVAIKISMTEYHHVLNKHLVDHLF